MQPQEIREQDMPPVRLREAHQEAPSVCGNPRGSTTCFLTFGCEPSLERPSRLSGPSVS